MSDLPAAVEQTPAAVAPDAAAPIPSEDAERAELSRIFKGEDVKEPEAAPQDAAPDPESEAESAEEAAPLAEVIAAPSHLPDDIQALWKDIPEAARPALERSYRSLGDRLAQQGRVVSAVKPSYDVLVQAAQELPALSNMTPGQIAEGVFSLARAEAAFITDPVNTLLGLAQKHGALEGLKSALAGGPVTPHQPQAPALSPAQLAQIVQEQVNEALTGRDTLSEVQAFASADERKAFWPLVEEAIPSFLPLAIKKLGEGASAKDKLSLAYDMAIHADPDLRAKVAPASKKEPEPDPQKAAEAARAASINVSSRGASKPAVMTERQMLEAAYREASRR